MKVNGPGRQKVEHGRNSWQWLKHVWLCFYLLQALKGTFVGSGLSTEGTSVCICGSMLRVMHTGRWEGAGGEMGGRGEGKGGAEEGGEIVGFHWIPCLLTVSSDHHTLPPPHTDRCTVGCKVSAPDFSSSSSCQTSCARLWGDSFPLTSTYVTIDNKTTHLRSDFCRWWILFVCFVFLFIW